MLPGTGCYTEGAEPGLPREEQPKAAFQEGRDVAVVSSKGLTFPVGALWAGSTRVLLSLQPPLLS